MSRSPGIWSSCSWSTELPRDHWSRPRPVGAGLRPRSIPADSRCGPCPRSHLLRRSAARMQADAPRPYLAPADPRESGSSPAIPPSGRVECGPPAITPPPTNLRMVWRRTFGGTCEPNHGNQCALHYSLPQRLPIPTGTKTIGGNSGPGARGISICLRGSPTEASPDDVTSRPTWKADRTQTRWCLFNKSPKSGQRPPRCQARNTSETK